MRGTDRELTACRLCVTDKQFAQRKVRSTDGYCRAVQCEVLTDSGHNVMNEVLTDIGETVQY